MSSEIVGILCISIPSQVLATVSGWGVVRFAAFDQLKYTVAQKRERLHMGALKRIERILTLGEHVEFVSKWTRVIIVLISLGGGIISKHFITKNMNLSLVWAVGAWVVCSALLYFLILLLWKLFTAGAPEIVLDYERNRASRIDCLIVRHIGGGSARNIEIGQMSNGHWAASFLPISYLAVGGQVEARPKFDPISRQAISDQIVGLGHMTLEFFLTTPVDVGPILVTTRHEDGASRFTYETDFEITYRMEDGMPYFSQRARRIRRLTRRSA